MQGLGSLTGEPADDDPSTTPVSSWDDDGRLESNAAAVQRAFCKGNQLSVRRPERGRPDDSPARECVDHTLSRPVGPHDTDSSAEETGERDETPDGRPKRRVCLARGNGVGSLPSAFATNTPSPPRAGQHLPVAAVDADAEDALGMADVVSAVERNSPPVRSPHGMRWPGAWPAEVSGNAMVVRAIRTRHLQAPAVSPGGEVGDSRPSGDQTGEPLYTLPTPKRQRILPRTKTVPMRTPSTLGRRC
jgi:hypothetical protein